MVNIAIDNLQHFTSFKRIDELKEERDRGAFILRSFSIADYISEELADVQKGFQSLNVRDDFDLLNSDDMGVDSEEFEEAQSRGMFKRLSINETKSNQSVEEEKDDIDEDDITNQKTQDNLNNLIMKRIDNMMTKAKERNPFCSAQHEQRVKDIREGKFKI